MAVLKKSGHKVYFSDEYLRPSNILKSSFLNRHRIDYVGIYSNTICYSSTLRMLKELHRKREQGEWTGKIMVGGPHTSVGHQEIPDFVDHIVIGEGEISVRKIIDGSVKDRMVRGETVQDLDTLPRPTWDVFISEPYNWEHHWFKTKPLFTMNTSRGCPFDCKFCSVKSIWGKTYRFMSAHRVVEDIQFMIKKYSAQGIYFREDNFTLNKKRTIEFCQLLLSKNIKIDWFCETRVDRLDDEPFQQLMKDAGCKVFYIGVESGSPRMLEFYNKGETREQFIKAFRIAKKVGIKTYASFIFGFPTETQKDREMSDDLITEIKPDFVGRSVFVGIPGSELYDFIKDNNLYEYEDESHILYPVNYKENVKKYYNDKPYFHAYYKKVGLLILLKTLKANATRWIAHKDYYRY